MRIISICSLPAADESNLAFSSLRGVKLYMRISPSACHSLLIGNCPKADVTARTVVD